MKQISLAVLALLSLVNVQAITHKQQNQITAEVSEQAYVESLNELNRYIGSDGEPINLAQTGGHARLALKKVPIRNQSLAQQNPLQTIVQSTVLDEVTHCPINADKMGPAAVRLAQTNLEDNAYISEVFVGNPPQKIRALFDTGSTNTWVLNKKVELPNGATKELSYDDEASTTKKKLAQRAVIQFGSGALAGHFMTDDMRVGTCDAKSTGQIHIKNQKFGNVEKQSTIFTGSNFEAIIGMAYPALAEKGVKPVFDEMIDQQLLKKNVFAFYFTTKQAEGMGLQSDLTFGYYDKAKFKGDIHWNPIKFKYMFGVQLDDIKFNGQSSGICKDRPQGCLITFDSGTSLMSMPTFATNKLIQMGIPTSKNIMKCQGQQQFGEMSLVIGGKEYKLTNEEWMFPAQNIAMAQGGSAAAMMNRKIGPLGPQMMAQTVSSIDEFKPTETANAQIETEADRRKKQHLSDTGSGDMRCASTIMTMDIAKDMFLVGDIFMRKFYTIFDRDNDRVGLAEAITNDKIKQLNQGAN